MRKLNLFLIIGMLVTFIAHALMGSLRLFGANAQPFSAAAWASLAFVAAHVIVSSVLTAQTLLARKRAGAGYLKGNRLFWVRRLSGFLILIPLVLHLTVFSASDAEVYRLRVFTTGRLVSQLLFAGALALHILSNVRPALISFGVKDTKAFTVDLLLILTVLLLIFAAAFAVYYVRWAMN